MKRHISSLAGVAVALSVIISPPRALAQGSLTPPGPPAPTMKTLDQIEARTPIASVPFTISQPGSYYLTTNVTTAVSNAITIEVSGVTLDLNGFTITSSVADAANGGTAILLNGGLSDITIANGHIRGGVTNNGSGIYSGSGFGYGIHFYGDRPVNVLVSRVSVSGCFYYGIVLNISDSTMVEDCTVRTVGSIGISASTVKTSAVYDSGLTAIVGDEVSDCRGLSSGNGYGVIANVALNCYGTSNGNGYGVNAGTALNCLASSVTSYGIYATTAQNCNGASSNSYGIYAQNVQNSYGKSVSGTGLLAGTTAENCYGSSNGGGYGIQAGTALNCDGSSGSNYGVTTAIAQGCYGSSSSGVGVNCSTALNCYGYSGTGTGLAAATAQNCIGYCGGGTAINAIVANGCYTYGGTNNITYKYNMP